MRGRGRTPWTRIAIATLALAALVVIVFAELAWRRRWIADDGLIVVRTVRQILAGNGPVYSPFERVETSTSTLWTWLLALVCGVIRRDVAHTAVYLGGLLAIGGMVLGLDGARRLQRRRGSTAILVPAGALVMIGVFPFWDYATSGLETGLCTGWLALVWWLLVRLRADATARSQLLTAIVFGLGPLVRPDFGIVTIVFLVAGWSIVRPTRGRALLLFAAAFTLPALYEVFRAGYYGILVPMPALAKSASSSEWARGLRYVRDYLHPYALWVPFGALAATLVLAWRRGAVPRAERIVVLAPVVAGVLLTLYVVRVGGDFMHARMCLPPTLLLLLPAFVVPLRRWTAPALVAVAAWALVVPIVQADGTDHSTQWPIEDEHAGYCTWTQTPHPIGASAFIRADRPSSEIAARAVHDRQRVMISEDSGIVGPLAPDLPANLVYACGRLGTGGVIAPLDDIVADILGLANPIGARITPTLPGYTGHEKPLPRAWLVAAFVDPANDTVGPADVSLGSIRAARHALTCGAIAEVLASVHEPLTAARFWDNLTGSVARTRLVIPSDPTAAEQAFCPDGTGQSVVTASSSFEAETYSTANVSDGQRVSAGRSAGYSSAVGQFEDHTEWLAMQLARPRPISKVTLYPIGDGDGFPIDFEIQIWDGEDWVRRAVVANEPSPHGKPRVVSWGTPDMTDRVRLLATHLSTVRGGYVLQLAELEAD